MQLASWMQIGVWVVKECTCIKIAKLSKNLDPGSLSFGLSVGGKVDLDIIFDYQTEEPPGNIWR